MKPVFFIMNFYSFILPLEILVFQDSIYHATTNDSILHHHRLSSFNNIVVQLTVVFFLNIIRTLSNNNNNISLISVVYSIHQWFHYYVKINISICGTIS